MAASKAISPFRLSSLLRLQKDPVLAFELFKNPSSNLIPNKPFRYSLLSYDLIITKLGRAKMFDQMEEVLHQLKQETRFDVPEVLFCEVIACYGRARLPARAMRTFESIPSFQSKRTVKSLNSLLNALLYCREYEKMRELLLGIDNYGSPDACTYNIMINAWCIRGDMEQAWDLFDEMQKRGIQPDVVTFGTLINGLCLNSQLQEALRLKQNMTRVFRLRPNAPLYTTLIREFCRIGELEEAFRFKDEMLGNKVMPDSAVYNTLAAALFKAGRKEEALGVLEEMKKGGCKPNLATYNVMITGFCQEKNFEQAYKILDGMDGFKPDVVSYNVMISWLCKEGKWSEANDLFQDMPRRGCAPDVVSYRTLFDGLCVWMQFKEAAFLLDEMIFKGYKPLCGSINKFVDGLCQEGNFKLLSVVLISLGKGNVLNEHIWRMVVSVVCKEQKQKPSELSKLFDILKVP